MVTWLSSRQSERLRFSAISIVFLNYSNLLDFFFEKDCPRIRYEPDEMLRQILGLSSGEQILVRVALDIWSGSGDAKIWELVETLDDYNFSNVLKALAVLRLQISAN